MQSFRIRAIDLRKKMKPGLMTLLLMIGGILCDAQEKIHRKTDIMVDIGAAVIAESLKIHLSHEFSEHWTIEAAAGLCLGRTKSKTEDEKSHEGFLSDTAENYCFDAGMSLGLISAVYWPVNAYKGPYLHAGCSVGEDSSIDMAVGAGYCVRIWKGVAARVFSRIDILNSYKKGKVTGEPLSLGIGYIF